MINQVILVGRIGQDAELREFNAHARCTFSLATFYKKKSGEEVTQWHRIVMWGRIAEVLHSYLKKGRQVYVQGSVEYRDYTDKQGIARKITEIQALKCQLLGDRSGPRQEPPPARPPPVRAPEDLRDEDIPF